MAKRKNQTSTQSMAPSAPAASGATHPAKAPVAKKSSEIDDIFSSKPKPKAAAPAATESPPAPAMDPSSTSAKAAKKKRKVSEVETDASKNVPAAPGKPTAAASGVKVVEFSDLDTGKPVSSAPAATGTSEPSSKKRKIVESMDEFLGNNGKKRFTDDGYPLYYIEDLLAQGGGDTDLCPFECECCF